MHHFFFFFLCYKGIYLYLSGFIRYRAVLIDESVEQDEELTYTKNEKRR